MLGDFISEQGKIQTPPMQKVQDKKLQNPIKE